MPRFILLATVVVLLFVRLTAAQPINRTPAKDDGLLDLNEQWSYGRAEGKGAVRLTHPPLRVADIGRIIPYGMMVGGHVMPIDHQYYYPRGNEACDVFAPAAGHVVLISHRVQLHGSTEKPRDYDDFALHIEHTGTFYTFYDLLTELDPLILKELDAATRTRFAEKQQGPPVHVRIPVKAGQVVGKVRGRSLDVALINTETRLKGLLTPRLYGHYAWRLHLVDPFDYFDAPLQGELLQLNERTAKPRGGKIDYDVDGRLIGNWFREGANGYAGTRDPRGYWLGHLAIVYHHLDTDKVIVSIGDFAGRPRQFGVKGNGPDPAAVSSDDGPVKYELINLARPSAIKPFEGADGTVQGVLLVQVLAGRKLNLEVFAGKTAADVTGFTGAAKIYER